MGPHERAVAACGVCVLRTRVPVVLALYLRKLPFVLRSDINYFVCFITHALGISPHVSTRVKAISMNFHISVCRTAFQPASGVLSLWSPSYVSFGPGGFSLLKAR